MLLRTILSLSVNGTSKTFGRIRGYSPIVGWPFSIANYSTNRELDVATVSCDFIHASDESTLHLVCEDFRVYENFITEDEETSLVNEAENHLKRLPYEKDHWDDAIHAYREREHQHFREKNKLVLQRVRNFAFPPDAKCLPHVHILDLHKSGYIKPHVDSVRFCGDTIAGLSLLSDSVMRLVCENNKQSWADILLRRRSLYIMSGVARYKYTHEILKEEQSVFCGKVVPRDRRISIICRTEPVAISDSEGNE